MPVPAGYIEAYQLFHGDGSPVIHNGREVWVGRCGRELTGLRSDGLPANMVPAVFLGERKATVKVTPGEGATSPGEVVISPGPGLQPFGGGGGFGGGAGGAGDGGGVEILGHGRTLREDREVYVGRACVPTGTPPQLPLGGHIGVPLGADFSRAGDTRRVMAAGCVECEVPPLGNCLTYEGQIGQPPDRFIRVTLSDGTDQCVCVDGFTERLRYGFDGRINGWLRFERQPLCSFTPNTVPGLEYFYCYRCNFCFPFPECTLPGQERPSWVLEMIWLRGGPYVYLGLQYDTAGGSGGHQIESPTGPPCLPVPATLRFPPLFVQWHGVRLIDRDGQTVLNGTFSVTITEEP